MTGNLVLLGVAAGEQDPDLAWHAAAAVACFVVGVALGTWLARAPRASAASAVPGVAPAQPSSRLVRTLAVELALFAAFAIGWLATGGSPEGDAEQLPLLAVCAVALGLQSGAMLRSGIKGLSTTYLTGTLTTLVARLTSGHGLREVSDHASVLGGLIGGAAAGGLIFLHAPRWAPLLPLVLLAAVLVGAVRARSAAHAHEAS